MAANTQNPASAPTSAAKAVIRSRTSPAGASPSLKSAEFGLLTTGTVKAGDQSRRWYPGIGGDRSLTCEAEALPPDLLARLVRDAIEAEVDMKVQRIVDLEEIERAQAITAMAEVDF